MSCIWKYIKNIFNNICILIARRDYKVINYNYCGFNYVYVYKRITEPQNLTHLDNLNYFSFRTKIIYNYFKNKNKNYLFANDLFDIVINYYERIFISNFHEIYNRIKKTKIIFMIAKYAAPLIVCNYIDSINESEIHYNFKNKHKLINKYLRRITDVREQIYNFSLFITENFHIEYNEYKKKKRDILIERTNTALNILQKKYNINYDVSHIIKSYIL